MSYGSSLEFWRKVLRALVDCEEGRATGLESFERLMMDNAGLRPVIPKKHVMRGRWRKIFWHHTE